MNRYDRPGERPLRNPETGSEYRHPFGSREDSRVRRGHIAIDGPPVWTEVGTSDSEWMRDLWSFSTAPLTLILMGFTALLLLPVALWARSHSEDIVIWALENETVSESATRWLPDAVETGSTIATGILALAAIPAYVTLVAFARRAPLIRFVTDVIWGVALLIGRPLLPFVRTAGQALVLTAALLARAVTLVARITLDALGVIREVLVSMPVALIVVAWLSGRGFVVLIGATIAGLVWLITPPARAVTRTARYIRALITRPLHAALEWLAVACNALITGLNTLLEHFARTLTVARDALYLALVSPVVHAAVAVRRTATAAVNVVLSTTTQALHWLVTIAFRLAGAAKQSSVLALSRLASWLTTALTFVRTHVIERPVRWFLSALRFAQLLLRTAATGIARSLTLVVSALAIARAHVQRQVVEPAIRIFLMASHSTRLVVHVGIGSVWHGLRLLSGFAAGMLATTWEHFVTSALHASLTAFHSIRRLFNTVARGAARGFSFVFKAELYVLVATGALIATLWHSAVLLTSSLARVLTAAFATLSTSLTAIAMMIPFAFAARSLRLGAIRLVVALRVIFARISTTTAKALAYAATVLSRALAVVTHAVQAIHTFLVALFLLPARPFWAASLWISGLIAAGWRAFAGGLETLWRAAVRALATVLHASARCLAPIWQVTVAIGALLRAIGLHVLYALSLPLVLLELVWKLTSDSATALGRFSGQVAVALTKPIVAAGGAYVGGLVSAWESVARLPWGRIASGGIGGAFLAFVIYAAMVAQPNPQVTVVHWSTGHLIRDGSDLRLLRQMAEEFNAQGHLSPSGKPIKVEVFYQGGAEQAPELISRVTTGKPIDKALPNPTLVTPSASHWLVNVNYAAGFEVINLNNTEDRSLARTYVGIVTYKDMAACLGWPEVEVSFDDLIALRNHPDGWASRDCANPDWGTRPLIAFTDPSSSDTGRAVLLSLYLIASGKEPETLTEHDLNQPAAVEYIRSFQTLVDHYMPSTIPLNTRICEGPRYGHFFIMPEDNLVHLLDGTEKCFVNGIERNAPPLRGEMVIMYPKEGSLLRENCACAVKADWVDEEEAAATELWVKFLRQDAQQQSFVRAGFHPGTSMTGNDARVNSVTAAPQHILHPERMVPAVAQAIDQSWQIVKRPAIVTFVADTSGSMLGDKLRNEKTGLREAMEEMASNNSVGLVTFGDTARRDIEVGVNNRDEMSRAIDAMRAGGETALYDAIRLGISMTDAADGPTDAIRAVVVITDGRANRGTTCMHDLVSMTSADERAIDSFCGLEDQLAREQGGRELTRTQIAGAGLAMRTTHSVQIFYVAIGKDADLDIGRILSGATGAEFRGVTEADLSEVILEFSHYF